MSLSCFHNISLFLRGNQLFPGGCTSKQTAYFLVLSSDTLCSALPICFLSACSEGQPESWYMCHQPQETLLVRWCCHVDAICLFIWWHLFTQHESGKRLPSQQNGIPQRVHGHKSLPAGDVLFAESSWYILWEHLTIPIVRVDWTIQITCCFQSPV